MPDAPVFTEADREVLDRLLARLARSADAVEQVLDLVDRVADSGNLGALTGVLESFDENFSAATRPELMTMVANLMMLAGLLGQVRYEPLFHAAMRVPATLDQAYERLRTRTRPMGLGEMLRLVRSPEMAGVLELVVAVARALRAEPKRPS
ncbi:MAG: hypothetical protein KatS3mg013_0707 [Actinomycetota bacterium]|jgi:uncharacterized protein YjgD (DUF1641 family)|nr:MAG: hypothetical protein KatS3mg013_0707 [Actinomycetota bacterium]